MKSTDTRIKLSCWTIGIGLVIGIYYWVKPDSVNYLHSKANIAFATTSMLFLALASLWPRSLVFTLLKKRGRLRSLSLWSQYLIAVGYTFGFIHYALAFSLMGMNPESKAFAIDNPVGTILGFVTSGFMIIAALSSLAKGAHKARANLIRRNGLIVLAFTAHFALLNYRRVWDSIGSEWGSVAILMASLFAVCMSCLVFRLPVFRMSR